MEGEEERQIKNIKNKLIDFINKSVTIDVIRLAVICKIKIPKQLITKYLQ